jgi:hypothetical protein
MPYVSYTRFNLASDWLVITFSRRRREPSQLQNNPTSRIRRLQCSRNTGDYISDEFTILSPAQQE